MRFIPPLCCLLLGLSAGSAALAHEKGDIILRAGAANASPNEDSDRIDIAGLAVLDGVTVGSNTQLGITATYMLSDSIGIGLLAATPFEHDIAIENLPVRAGSTKHLPPTLTLQYFFGESSSAFRPYVGVGINNTTFFEEETHPELDAALEGIVGAPITSELDLDPSWGLAAEVGLDYRVSDNWGVNATIWYIDLSTDATIRTSAANVNFNVDIDPLVYMVGLTYTF